MKPTSSVPRRTALAIAAASAGLTLAITATIASSLGLLAPAAPVATPSTGQEQPSQQPPVPMMSDGLTSIPSDSVGQPDTTEMTRQAARVEEGRSARREHDDDDRGVRPRQSSPSDAAAGRSARQVVGRTHHEEDDDD